MSNGADDKNELNRQKVIISLISGFRSAVSVIEWKASNGLCGETDLTCISKVFISCKKKEKKKLFLSIYLNPVINLAVKQIVLFYSEVGYGLCNFTVNIGLIHASYGKLIISLTTWWSSRQL